MRHTGFSLWLAVGLVFGAFVTDAVAQVGGGGGFWEKMSGPGAWKYFFGSLRTCLDREEKRDEADEDSEVCTLTKNRVWLNLGGSYAWTGEEDREDLQSPDLKQISIEPSVDLRVVNLFNYAPLHLGLGAGVHWFWGEDVGLTRASLEPRVVVIYWRPERLGLDFGVRYAVKFFFKGFTAEDFGDPTGTFTTNGTDAIHTFFWYVAF